MTSPIIKPSEDKQRLILDAAQRRFAHFGPSKVTMDEIASDVGMCKAALYYYFTTKEEIFRQVISREQREFMDRVAVISKEQCPASEKLLHYFNQHLTFLNELLNLKILSVHATDTIHPIMRELFREFAREETLMLETILSEGKNTAEFIIESARTTALLLLHVLQGLRMRFFKITEQFDESEIRVFSEEITLFSQVFIKGISH